MRNYKSVLVSFVMLALTACGSNSSPVVPAPSQPQPTSPAVEGPPQNLNERSAEPPAPAPVSPVVEPSKNEDGTCSRKLSADFNMVREEVRRGAELAQMQDTRAFAQVDRANRLCGEFLKAHGEVSCFWSLNDTVAFEGKNMKLVCSITEMLSNLRRQ